MRSLDNDLIQISKIISEQSNLLARVVNKSTILRATSEELLARIREHLRIIEANLDDSTPDADWSRINKKVS